MTGSARPELFVRQRTTIPTRDQARGRRPGVVLLLVGGLLAVAAGGLLSLRDASVPAAGDVGVASTSAHTLDVDYADAPSVELIAYAHGDQVSYAIELRNDGPLPITVEDVPIGAAVEERRLIHPHAVLVAPEGSDRDEDPVAGAAPFEPFRLDRGASRTVILRGVFHNCAYYTERAIDLITSQPVTWSVAGWSTTTDVPFDRQLAVRSPHIRNCPGRVMDRGAATRTG